jgi:uncharacterized integral membrane protein
MLSLILVIILQNTQVVTLQLFFWNFEMSRIVLIVLTLVFGFVIGYVVARLTASPSGIKGEK